MLQDYLKGSAQDIDLRMFYLGNYLLVKGDPDVKKEMTYLCYFAHDTLEWYPEWEISLGKPTYLGGRRTVDNLKRPGAKGIYQRDFANGNVMVNPTKAAITVALKKAMHLVAPKGGGAVTVTKNDEFCIKHHERLQQKE